jgi:predicted O-linked N-acetylglucosamine transferase (SPINDLY family)
MTKESGLGSNSSSYFELVNKVAQSNDVKERECILQNLIYQYPKNTELYYYMGIIWERLDENRALMWYHICYAMNPLFIDNILNFTLILFQRGEYLKIRNLNIDFQRLKDDSRLKLLEATLYLKERNNYKAHIIFNTLLDDIENGKITNIDLCCIILTNCVLFYGIICNHNKAHECGQKLIYLIETKVTNTNTNSLVIVAYQNYLMSLDYTYHDLKKRYQLAKSLQSLYTSTTPTIYAKPLRKEKKECLVSYRIAYLASSCTTHVLVNFILPILNNHNKTTFDVVLYSEQDIDSKNNNYHYECTLGKTNNEIANDIRMREIDILIDLEGYTEGNRLGVLALRPSPIQMTYLGYVNSTGLDFIQYRITDGIADSPESEQMYSETKIYLPRCFLLFQSILQFRNLSYRPCNPKCIYLGSLNKELKTTNDTLQVWSRILQMTSNTKIIVKLDVINDINNMEERKKYYVDNLGIDKDRIIIAHHGTDLEYIDLFHKIDLLLDPFPYSGTTTSCNALCNSVPIITMYHKDYHAHNVTSSLLKNIGLDELITKNKSEYVEKVVKLCENPSRLDEYRQTIFPRFMELMEPNRFMREYEELLINTYENDPCNV